MKKMLSGILVLTVLASSAFAADVAKEKAKEAIEMKDGATLYVFPDGKMAMESKYGKALHMQPGVVMESKDGRKFAMNGNEIMRLDNLLKEGHRSR